MEDCIEVLNELGGQCLPQHQLTQLLITALIREAEGESPCNPEYKCPAETHWCTRAHAHTMTAEKQKNRLYKKGYVYFRLSLSLPSFLTYLSPTLPLLSMTLDLSDQTKKGWKHIWPQNSPNTFYLESLRQRVKGTCCPNPKTWSNSKRMSTGVVCQLPKLREKLVFLLWRQDANCLSKAQRKVHFCYGVKTEETSRNNEDVSYLWDFLSVKHYNVSKPSFPDFCFSVSAAV